MIIYITAVNDDFSTNIPKQCIVLLYMVRKLHVIVTISFFVTELTQKTADIFFFFLHCTYRYAGMYNTKYYFCSLFLTYLYEVFFLVAVFLITSTAV